MNKTYRFRLPQNKEVEKMNVRVENGEVLVGIKFKEILEPKDGDFLVVDGDVFIYNGKQTDDCFGAYVGTLENREINLPLTADSWAEKEYCRYATPEEKSAFLERLEKECHKRWNEETKQLEDIRWKPTNGENYWYITEDLEVAFAKYDDMNNLHVFRAHANNCFKTPEATSKVFKKIKEIFKNSKAE